jgi:hypothetical protein
MHSDQLRDYLMADVAGRSDDEDLLHESELKGIPCGMQNDQFKRKTPSVYIVAGGAGIYLTFILLDVDLKYPLPGQ